ncbi:MAG: ATP-binding protein, partial [Rhodanobacter sp.]
METTLEVNDASQVAEVRRVAAQLAQAEDMTPVELGRVALVATELATNLVKYGKGGTMTLSRFAARGQRGVQLIAVDRGPGFADFAAAARDGHSTTGSLGLGLGVIQRSSSLIDHYTVVGQGTALLAQLAHGVSHRASAAAPPASFELAARSSP